MKNLFFILCLLQILTVDMFFLNRFQDYGIFLRKEPTWMVDYTRFLNQTDFRGGPRKKTFWLVPTKKED